MNGLLVIKPSYPSFFWDVKKGKITKTYIIHFFLVTCLLPYFTYSICPISLNKFLFFFVISQLLSRTSIFVTRQGVQKICVFSPSPSLGCYWLYRKWPPNRNECTLRSLATMRCSLTYSDKVAVNLSFL